MKLEPTIEDFMTLQPQTIEAGESLQKASETMSKLGIRHLPVTKNGKLAGILSERELNLAMGMDSIHPGRLLVIDVCSEKPYTVRAETPLRRVVETMAEKHYGSAVVEDDGRIVGIFTTVDACRALADTLRKIFIDPQLEAFRKARCE